MKNTAQCKKTLNNPKIVLYANITLVFVVNCGMKQWFLKAHLLLWRCRCRFECVLCYSVCLVHSSLSVDYSTEKRTRLFLHVYFSASDFTWTYDSKTQTTANRKSSPLQHERKRKPFLKITPMTHDTTIWLEPFSTNEDSAIINNIKEDGIRWGLSLI